MLGADPPLRDRRRAHGRRDGGLLLAILPIRGSHRVIVALCGVCRSPTGTWANVALAAHPGGFLRSVDLPEAGADPGGLGVWARGERTGSFQADGGGIVVDLGPDARLEVRLTDPWPRRQPMLGGVGPAQLIPGLGQYWDPHLLGARVRGRAVLGSEVVGLEGLDAYAEKNWGAGGFPSRWWWGQAQGFARRDVAVAFAGGEVTIGPAAIEATGVVVRLGEQMFRLGNPLLAPARVRADGEVWSLRARGPRYGVELEGRAAASDLAILPVPVLARRSSVPAAHQHLASELRLIVRRRGRVVFAGESATAGLEVGAV